MDKQKKEYAPSMTEASRFMESFEGCTQVLLLENRGDYVYCKYIRKDKRLMECLLYNLGGVKISANKPTVRQ